jgi:hypothetical protein
MFDVFFFFHRLAKVSNIRDNQERKDLFFLLRHSLSAQPSEQTNVPNNGERYEKRMPGHLNGTRHESEI